MTGIAAPCAWLLATTFMVAGAIKLRTPKTFAAELGDYGLVPAGLLRATSVALPVLELALGIAAVLPATRSVGLVGLLVLLVIFTCAVGTNLLRGRRDIACACFGRSRQTLTWRIPVRNGILGALALIAVIAPPGEAASLPGAMLVLFAALMACLLFEYSALSASEAGLP